jgi:hypothetical protein
VSDEGTPRILFADDPGPADKTIDLRGLSEAEALARLAAETTDSGVSFILEIDPPAGDGTVTLFPVIGRELLARRRKGELARLIVRERGAGFWIRTA